VSLVFVTGASGFLGAHIARELLAAGHQVRALSRRSETDAPLRAAGIEPVRASLADRDSLRAALAGCEAVFHAAADTSTWRAEATAQHATNVDGTRHLLAAAADAGVAAFMHTSSISAWSHLVQGRVDEAVPQRGGESWIHYERTKFESEQLVRASTLPWIVFNPTQILGPGDRHNWARLIVLVDQRKLPGIPPGGGAFADVREIARSQVHAWQQRRFGACFILGGEPASFLDLVGRVGQRLGRPVPRRATPRWLMMAVARLLNLTSQVSGAPPRITPEAATLTSRTIEADDAKARRELGYRHTPLNALLADMLAWMKAESLIAN
jgi:dihydroflavonol-4-reductase